MWRQRDTCSELEVYVKIEIQRQTRVYGDTEIQRQRGVCYMEIIDKQYRVERGNNNRRYRKRDIVTESA